MKITNSKTRYFGEKDFVIDREDIVVLGQTNPIIHKCLTLYYSHTLTYEQAMMSAVKFLSIQNENMFKALVRNLTIRKINGVEEGQNEEKT